MIARIAENSYVDIDAISAITGDYTNKNSDKWETTVLIGSTYGTFKGTAGKNIMDAYEWKWKHSIVDMIPGDNYKKQLFRGK